MGRTFGELDVLFRQGVPARKFAETHVDVFDENIDTSVIIKSYENASQVSLAKPEAVMRRRPGAKK